MTNSSSFASGSVTANTVDAHTGAAKDEDVPVALDWIKIEDDIAIKSEDTGAIKAEDADAEDVAVKAEDAEDVTEDVAVKAKTTTVITIKSEEEASDAGEPTVCIPGCCVSLIAHAVIQMLRLPENVDIFRDAARVVLAKDDAESASSTTSEAGDVSVNTSTDLPTTTPPPPVYDPPIPGLSARAVPLVYGLPVTTVTVGNAPPAMIFVPHPGASSPFYCVARGLAIGIFSNWLLTQPLVIGVSSSSFKSFDTLEAAMDAMVSVIRAGGHQVLN
ncbi:hypothetical protein BJ138DRAFT_1120664 [Hygrophoropsis aurantiaca]|uniref:Uncharacterized protein n=1 Tax=Hygrophoropsis aurantiaca TaxID=72124 RepID=A0ACB7ZQ13_9AGAM|nr:hypothetical protein BJ138DRAFT_1120664 [Hygrophoropsis aurantiaca]